ncbi:MAG: hypothetical protein NT030_08390 [Candidatus Saganbacteria bacterium]|nr:hypothetical protein [Candidatus Saganbacteria bacterium]
MASISGLINQSSIKSDGNQSDLLGARDMLSGLNNTGPSGNVENSNETNIADQVHAAFGGLGNSINFVC